MKEDRKDKALRQHVLELLRGGGAHAKFDEIVAGIPPERARPKARRVAAFALDATGTHAHSAVGHYRVQPQPETCFSKMARRILAGDGSSAQRIGVERKRQEGQARPKGDGGVSGRSEDRSVGQTSLG